MHVYTISLTNLHDCKSNFNILFVAANKIFISVFLKFYFPLERYKIYRNTYVRVYEKNL